MRCAFEIMKQLCISTFIFLYSCKNVSVREHHVQIMPDYNEISMRVTSDTLLFPLDEDVLPVSPSFNYKKIDGKRLISFTDYLSHTLNIYNFNKRISKFQVQVPHIDPNGNRINEFNGWFQNYDSIYLCSNFKVYRMNSYSEILDSIDLLNQKGSIVNTTRLINYAPPIFYKSFMYLPAYPYLSSRKKDDLDNWKMLCRINLISKEAELFYKPPAIYRHNFYGTPMMRPYYCFNSKGQFVFSFPILPELYVFNPDSPYTNLVYNAMSNMLKGNIEPLNEKELSTGEAMSKSSLLRNSYGAVYYDNYHKRYLRVAEQKLTLDEVNKKEWKKEHSLIIFDENFKIIGESSIDKNINLYTLFITEEGIFARTDAMQWDESNLYFVRLEYVNKGNEH